MECPKGHTWVETFPKESIHFGICPRCGLKGTEFAFEEEK